MDTELPSRSASQVANHPDLGNVWCGKAGLKAKSAAIFGPVQRLFCPLEPNGQKIRCTRPKIAADFALTRLYRIMHALNRGDLQSDRPFGLATPCPWALSGGVGGL
jgi:hypothetical protein